MIRPVPFAAALRRLVRADGGTTLVEFAVVLPIFLLILFTLIDFGRLGFQFAMAEKAMQKAVRLAVVRPAACPGVPEVNTMGAVPVGTVTPKYGTNCSTAAYVCAAPAVASCAGSGANATAAEIWTAIQPLMPPNATVANLNFTYAYTADFGFVGGPYTPMVTVKVTGLSFDFISPLGALAALAGIVDADIAQSLVFPAMPQSLPAEDLNSGTTG